MVPHLCNSLETSHVPRIELLIPITSSKLKEKHIRMKFQRKPTFLMMLRRCFTPTMLIPVLISQRHYFQVQEPKGMRFELPRRNWKNSLTSKRSINSWEEERESSRAAGGTVSLVWTMLTLRTHQCSTENRKKRKTSTNLKRTRSTTTDFKVSYFFHFCILTKFFN